MMVLVYVQHDTTGNKNRPLHRIDHHSYAISLFCIMGFFKDQLGRDVDIPVTPKRIISVVPSQTELLFDLGLNEEVIGITKFCVHPKEWFQTKTRVGGTKQLNLEKIRELQPDLIIANKEENVREQIEALAADFPVWISDVDDLEGALEMISAIGKITGRESKAMSMFNQIREQFKKLDAPKKTRAAYLIWQKPFMTIGGDSFISDMMNRAGFENIFSAQTRYPETTIEEINGLGCEVLMLSSEPYPFNQKHVEELQPLLPNTRIILVDGEMFSWYGSRLLKAPTYFQQLRINN